MISTRFVADGDGSCVWVHSERGTIARFGRVAFEIFDGDDPHAAPVVVRGSGLEQWRRFRDMVATIHGFGIPDEFVPVRFRDELGLNDAPTFMLDLATIAEFRDPFRFDVWGRTPLTREDVQQAIDERDFVRTYMDMGIRTHVGPKWDARRVAYFVVHPDHAPIGIEVDEEGNFGLDDGYHRLAAAIFRGDATIRATMGGYMAAWDVHFRDRIPVNRAAELSFDESACAGARP